jgi:cystathionine gamma-synthase
MEKEINMRIFLAEHLPLFGVFFPLEKLSLVIPFWQTTGTGITSRRAEAMLKQVRSIQEVDLDHNNQYATPDSSMLALQQRLVKLIDTTPISARSSTSTDDVYLFQTGMATIFYVHDLLRKGRGDIETIQFGVPFHQTRAVFKFWGSGFHFVPQVTDLNALDDYIASHPVLAIWTEMSLNPLLVSPDLQGLRKIATKYNIPLLVDDTVGSFCNVDVLGLADIVITSLTKSFSGYADVMGGSAILNKDSPVYPELKVLFEKNYHNDVFSGDAQVLLSNSANYYERSAILNKNAQKLVNYLHPLVSDPRSSVTNVFHPSVSPTRTSYDAVKRPITESFVPGYGCLFTVELETVDQAIAFYDNLHFYQGPHFAAHRTICLPYARLAYDDAMPEAEAWGLRTSQIRISVGLEDGEVLLETVKHALTFADEVKAGEVLVKS